MIYRIIANYYIRSSSFLIQGVFGFDTVILLIDLGLSMMNDKLNRLTISSFHRSGFITDRSHFYSYSVRRLFTGFISAARIAWKLTVINAMINAIIPAKAKIHQLMFIR